jgi:hypothetical protein
MVLENLQALSYTCNAPQKQNKDDATLTLESGERMCMMQGKRTVCVCFLQSMGGSKSRDQEFACNSI